MIYAGSCHCGKIAYEVEGELTQVVECNCSICTRRGYLLWFLPADQLRLKTPESDMSHYTFNTHRIKHYFCAACGCGPFGMGADKAGKQMAAVNVRCLVGVDPKTLTLKPFDGRSLQIHAD
jgi:hypothetical protein